MKSEELMIGDWVMVKERKGDDVKDYPIMVHIGTFTDIVAGNFIVEPIKLTQEILKKNGFEYFHGNCAALSPEDKFGINHVQWPDENGIAVWEYGVIQIRFVHELQHLLRILKVEKEFVL